MTSQARARHNILLVHNYYQEPGGEDRVFDSEALLLRAHGHRVEIEEFDNSHLAGSLTRHEKFEAFKNCVWNDGSFNAVSQRLAASFAEIVHVHNFHPTASPSIHVAARRSGAAVVQTLHNYRLLCPNALFFRDGGVCELCLGQRLPVSAIHHKCYRNSATQSAATVAMIGFHRARKTWVNDCDVFIALSEFSRRKFILGGFPEDRVVVKPNFVEDPRPEPQRIRNDFLFVGRLVDYKGNSLLPMAWRRADVESRLQIIGGGPEHSLMENACRGVNGIEVLGPMKRQEILLRMNQACALVFPSLLYENFPMTLVEAFASGLPVIASRIGAIAEIVKDGETGLLFEPGSQESLAAAIKWAENHPIEMAKMGGNARIEFEEKYSPEVNYRLLSAAYERALTHRAEGRSG